MSQAQAQNIYDDPTFFSAYETLPRSQHGLSAAPEWPNLRNMVLNSSSTQTLDGQRVLDLGCGYGWFARWARDNGATSVKAVDISHKMISRAEQYEADQPNSTSLKKITFETGDIESLTFDNSGGEGGELYGLVYSSLTFHYIQDLARLYREIYSSLTKNGKLVFSVEHPICSAPTHPGPDWKSIEEDGERRKIWPLNNYCDEGWRITSWLGVDGVRKYHRTVETYVRLLLESGFAVTGFRDWAPSVEEVAEHPRWADERHRPYFLLIRAEKK